MYNETNNLSKMTIEDLYKAVEAEEPVVDSLNNEEVIKSKEPQIISVLQEQSPEQIALVNNTKIEQEQIEVNKPLKEESTTFNVPFEDNAINSIEDVEQEEVKNEPSVESVFNTMPHIDVPVQNFNEQPSEDINLSTYTNKLKEIEELISPKAPQIEENDKVLKPKRYNEMHIINNPKSSFGEAIKSIRTNLQFSSVDKEKQVILITSPQPSDGKSTISSNLAGAYAQDNKKVLIIDCDLRKGRQKEIFQVSSKSLGYTNMILNYIDDEHNYNINDYIVKSGIENIDLVPNGPIPPNPIELLDSEKNSELISRLKEIYDIIILDCPPVLGLSDTLIMTKYSDANLVVVSKGKTKLEFLAEVKKSFEKANTSITGVIINKVKQKHNSYYGYYGSK